MKNLETIKTDLFNHFASISELPDEYYTNDEICNTMKSAYIAWEDAEPEDADTILNEAVETIYNIWKKL